MKVFIHDHNQVLSEIRKHYQETNITECDAVLLWTDTTPFTREIIKLARALGKKVYTFQHGRKGSSKYYPPFNEPILSDTLFVWGEFDKNRLIKAGHPAKKIKVIGTTIFQNLPKKCNPSGCKTIVFCPEHWDHPVEENQRIRNELKKLKGWNVITKIIESHNPDDFDNVIQTNRESPEHLEKCKEVLSGCRLVIGVSESTFELMAQAMNIPVIIVEDWEPKAFGGDMRYTEYERLISPAAYRTTCAKLLDTIKEVLDNENSLEQERKQVAIDEGGINLNTFERLNLSK